MNINEYQPYIEINGHITEHQNKMASIEAEIIEVRRGQSMPVMPATIPQGATVEEVLEISAKNDPAYIPKLQSQYQALSKSSYRLEQERLKVVADFSIKVGEQEQSKLDLIQKKIAAAYVSLQQGLLEQSELHRSVVAMGSDGRGLNRRFYLILDGMQPEHGNAHQVSFYKDALETKMINKNQLSTEIIELFSL